MYNVPITKTIRTWLIDIIKEVVSSIFSLTLQIQMPPHLTSAASLVQSSTTANEWCVRETAKFSGERPESELFPQVPARRARRGETSSRNR